MTTAFSALAAGIVTLLEAAPAVSPRITRAATQPLPEQAANMVVVRLIGSTGDAYAQAGAPVNWDTTIAVECYARATADAPDTAVDALLQAVAARILADETLGGAAAGLANERRIEWDFESHGQNVACATFTFTARHTTGGNAIT